MPTARPAVETLAVLPTSALVPRLAAPSKNWTDPVGAPAPAVAETVAVKVTLLPNTDGDPLVVRATDVVPWLTTWVSAPVLPVKAASPL